MSKVNLEKLVFDPAESGESANVGAYLRSANGTLITHTTVGGKERLDVNTGAEYARGAAAGGTDRGMFALAVNPANQYAPLRVNADGELLVDVAIVSGADKAEDSTHASGDIGSYSLSVRQDVLASSTSANGDYQSFKTDALGSLWTRLSRTPQSDGFLAGVVSTFSVTTTAAAIPGSPLANRKELTIQNTSNRAVYYGYTNSVTSANGIRISAGAIATIKADATLIVYVISDNNVTVRYEELA